jgi:hypothetical protein
VLRCVSEFALRANAAVARVWRRYEVDSLAILRCPDDAVRQERARVFATIDRTDCIRAMNRRERSFTL